MAYSIILSDEATFDIIDANDWYNVINPTLSGEFEKEIERFLNTILDNPNKFQLKYKTARIVFLKKFPFGIHYLIDKKTIKVIAVFHTSRNPNNWSEQLNKK